MKNPYDDKATIDVEAKSVLSILPVQADDKDVQWLIQTHYYGRKLSPTPSVITEEITHDVFAQFEHVSKVQQDPRFISESLQPFTKEHNKN